MQREIIKLKKEKKISDAEHPVFFSGLFHFRKNKKEAECKQPCVYHFAVVKMNGNHQLGVLGEKSL